MYMYIVYIYIIYIIYIIFYRKTKSGCPRLAQGLPWAREPWAEPWAKPWAGLGR